MSFYLKAKRMKTYKIDDMFVMVNEQQRPTSKMIILIHSKHCSNEFNEYFINDLLTPI